MKVAILGFGNEGKSSADYWSSKDCEITVCDKNQVTVPEGYTSKLGESYLTDLDSFDVVVRSPGVHPKEVIAANNESILNKVTSNTNEFLKVCPTKNIIGVTGTKGKGTTSSLITEMLRATGHKVHLAGNIGLPPLELLKENIQPEDWVVLELSNFQLIDIRRSPHIAVSLLIEPEHQDWHGSVDEYVQAKQQLFRWQSDQDIAIYYSKNPFSQAIASVSKGQKIPYFSESGAYVNEGEVTIKNQHICKTDDIKLLGTHNWQNVCAAVTAVWQVTQDIEGIRKAITAFTGLPYRLELRGGYEGVNYYNDSFSSQPESAIAAIEAIHTPKVLILGGYDRNLDLARLADTVKKNEVSIRKAVLIGSSARRIAENLDENQFGNYEICKAKNMVEIVEAARGFAKAGDSIVLSPGFPSFDMFKNFEERGKMFNEAIPIK